VSEFIKSNLATLLLGVIFLSYVVFLIINKRWTALRQMTYDLIQKAEDTLQGSKRGKEKFEFVYNEIYNLLPVWIRLFVPKSYLKIKLQKWYNEIKNDLKAAEITANT
jgi:hypothetical protein